MSIACYIYSTISADVQVLKYTLQMLHLLCTIVQPVMNITTDVLLFTGSGGSMKKCSLFVWLWLVINDHKFPAGTVFFSHTNQPAVLSQNHPIDKSTSTKTIAKTIKFSNFSPYKPGSQPKSRRISNQLAYNKQRH